MGTFLDIMAWSAAEDASSAARGAEFAARDAEDAANEAREKSEELIDIHDAKERKSNVETLNRYYQDLYYSREPEAFNLRVIRSFVDANDYKIKQHHFSTRHYYYRSSFPLGTTVLISVLLFALFGVFENFYKLIPASVLAYVLYNNYLDFTNWYYWRDPKNRENAKQKRQNKRQKEVQEKYFEVVKKLKKDYPNLSIYGWSAKYAVDTNIRDIYEHFKKENPKKAKESLIRFYELALNITINKEYEASMLKMFYEQSDEVKRLANAGSLFCAEALAYSNGKG